MVPTCSTWSANSGSRVMAAPKKVAKKSSSMDEAISGLRKTKRSPSSAAWMLTAGVAAGAPRGRISSAATTTARNEAASIQ